MIYRADFKLKSTNINIVSPVIFSNVARVLYEIFEDEADKHIKKIIDSNTLISDMLLSESLPSIKIDDLQFQSEEKNMAERLKIYRKWKRNNSPKYDLKGIESTRIRIETDRQRGCAREGYLFYENEVHYDNVFSVYIYTEDKKVVSLFELAFEIFERCGFGIDTSVGMGQMSLIRKGGSIFIEDFDMLKSFNEDKAIKYTLSSAIVNDELLKNCELIRYKVSRYDSRTLNYVKPPYFLIDRGSSIKVKGKLRPYIYKLKDIYIYSCLFPISR